MNQSLSKILLLGFTALLISSGKLVGADSRQLECGFEENGNFAQAAASLQKAIADTNTPATERRKLEFDLDRLDRIRLDFPFTRAALFEKLKAAVRNVSADEFEKWIAEKRFDARVIDGEERFMVSSVANLFYRYPELNPRRIAPKDGSFQKALWENCIAIEQAAREKRPYVLPKQFEVTMTVTLDANTVTPGKTVSAWLPVPRSYPYQGDFELISSSSPVKQLAPETSAIRSAYLEQTAASNAPTVFKITYQYETKGVRFDADPEKVLVFDGTDPAIAVFTNEAPHVVF